MNANLVSIIRSSLAAAQAALDLIAQDTAPLVTATVAVTAAPAPTPVIEEYSTAAATPFSRLMYELQDPRYTLRSTRELSDKAGISYEEVHYLLEDNDIDYVTKRRRSDGAELIGLASRN